jgi:hypothetical protein
MKFWLFFVLSLLQVLNSIKLGQMQSNLLNQIAEKRKLLMNIYKENQIQKKPETHIETKHVEGINKKLDLIIDNINKVSEENKKLKIMLKTLVDMQFYTFQKVKDLKKDKPVVDYSRINYKPQKAFEVKEERNY